MKDIAAHCGVSVATVSRVLNGNYYVSPEIEKKVRDCIAAFDYSPNSFARGLKINKSGIIGYITSDISNSYHITVAKAIEDVIREHGYSLIVCSTQGSKEAEEQYLKRLESQGVDALILNSLGLSDSMVLEMNRSIPMVLVNRRLNIPGLKADFADCDNVEGMRTITWELLRAGHRRIFLLEGESHLSNARERFAGFALAFADFGISIDESYPYRYIDGYTTAAGVRGAQHLISIPLEDRPTAILGTNNLTTLGAMKTLLHSGYHIPEDFSLAGFNAIENIELMQCRPTLVSFDPYDIGRSAGLSILERIAGSDIENREFIAPATLVRGNSIQPIA